MRSGEERIVAMHRRAGELRREKRLRGVQIVSAAAGCVCLGVVVMIAMYMSGITGIYVSEGTSSGMRASIFGESSFLGFVIISIVSFLLGVSLTIFCFRLKKWQDLKDEENV